MLALGCGALAMAPQWLGAPAGPAQNKPWMIVTGALGVVTALGVTAISFILIRSDVLAGPLLVFDPTNQAVHLPHARRDIPLNAIESVEVLVERVAREGVRMLPHDRVALLSLALKSEKIPLATVDPWRSRSICRQLSEVLGVPGRVATQGV